MRRGTADGSSREARIITIVFSDASLSVIEIKQQARGLDPGGVALGAIDWQLLARSLACARGWQATTTTFRTERPVGNQESGGAQGCA